MSLFNGCKGKLDHDDGIIDKTEFPSAFEQISKAGMKEIEGIRGNMFGKKVVLTLKCKLCGRVRQLVNES